MLIKSKPKITKKMSLSTFRNKRSTYAVMISNSESIGSNQTIVPVVIKNVTESKSKKGSSFHRLQCIVVSKESIFLKARPGAALETPKRIKSEGDDDDGDAQPGTPVSTSGRAIGTTITPGQNLMTVCFDKQASSLEEGTMVKIALTTEIYNDRFTFKCDRIILDQKCSVVSSKIYENYIASTALAEVPTLKNLSADQFPEGTDPKYMSRQYVLPLSNDMSTFDDVELCLDDTDTARFFTLDKDSGMQHIGINSDVGQGKTANMLSVVYSHKNGSKILMKHAYKHTIWACFGVRDMEQWIRVAPRLVFHAKEWIVYGYSQLEKIQAIRGNADVTSGNGLISYSTGFVTKMGINMSSTAKAAGVELSHSFIEKHYGSDSGYTNDAEHTGHVLNTGWKVKSKTNRPYVLNLTDLSDDQFIKFLKEVKDKPTVKFYGVFDTSYDDVYEFDGSQEEREKFIGERKPVLVFAVNE